MEHPRHDNRDGVMVGLIAYASVAGFYVIFDLLASRGMFYTVNLLGRAAFRGLRDAGVLQYPVQLDFAAIFLYNGVHLVLSLLIGLIVMHLAGRAERDRSLAPILLLVIVSGFIVTILAVGWMSSAIRTVLPWWSIVAANAAAVGAATAYVVRTRPGVLGRLGVAAP